MFDHAFKDHFISEASLVKAHGDYYNKLKT